MSKALAALAALGVVGGIIYVATRKESAAPGIKADPEAKPASPGPGTGTGPGAPSEPSAPDPKVPAPKPAPGAEPTYQELKMPAKAGLWPSLDMLSYRPGDIPEQVILDGVADDAHESIANLIRRKNDSRTWVLYYSDDSSSVFWLAAPSDALAYATTGGAWSVYARPSEWKAIEFEASKDDIPIPKADA